MFGLSRPPSVGVYSQHFSKTQLSVAIFQQWERVTSALPARRAEVLQAHKNIFFWFVCFVFRGVHQDILTVRAQTVGTETLRAGKREYVGKRNSIPCQMHRWGFGNDLKLHVSVNYRPSTARWRRIQIMQHYWSIPGPSGSTGSIGRSLYIHSCSYPLKVKRRSM